MLATIPRIMFVGPGSGSGKTTLTCAVLRALQMMGHNPAAFKCGPDFIDPLFHSEVLGLPSCNLDSILCGEKVVSGLLAKNGQGHGLAIIEGVMGLYDGQGTSGNGSSNHLALLTNTPEILVISPRGQALTLAAEIFGYLHFAPNTLKGVVFNQCSARMYPFYRDIVAGQLKVYGHMPPLPEAAFPSRHLGLVTPAETEGMEDRLDALARACMASVDLEGLVALGQEAAALEYEPLELAPDMAPILVPELAPDLATEQGRARRVVIAVARDRAFCFYYRDNFDVLQELGATLAFFSPLEDEGLPEGSAGIILGGGYPEEFAVALAANTAMRLGIRQAVAGGMPVFAECGGFMYLCHSLQDREGASHAMVGAVAAEARMGTGLGPFGYLGLTAQRDTFLGPCGTHYTAHEFHYSQTDDNGNAFMAHKAEGKSWPCIHASAPGAREKIFAGYPHFHLRGNPALAGAFVAACRAWAAENAASCNGIDL